MGINMEILKVTSITHAFDFDFDFNSHDLCNVSTLPEES